MNIKTFSLLAVLFIPLIALSAQDSLIEKRSTEQLKHYQQQELALDSLIGRLSKEGETIKAIMSWMADYNTDSVRLLWKAKSSSHWKRTWGIWRVEHTCLLPQRQYGLQGNLSRACRFSLGNVPGP